MIPSVNFHLWEPCNMRCKFCFATFQDVKQSILPKGHLPKEQAIEVIHQLAELGFEKITFAGGEPTLCPWISDLITTAKNLGMTTCVVTNGSRLTENFLEMNKKNLDWIALSVDSINYDTNLITGRALTGNKPINVETYKSTVDKIKQHGYGLKINTVVSNANWNENLGDFIKYAQPKRWKVFQVLSILGQNDLVKNDLTISTNEFNVFINNHQTLSSITTIVIESNDEMKGTYTMVDPAGRFYDNIDDTYKYSLPIIEVGARIAIQQMRYDFKKFVTRGGIYNW